VFFAHARAWRAPKNKNYNTRTIIIIITPWCMVLLEKLKTLSWLINVPCFMELEGPLTCSQEPVIGP
jgi:hypothetical protein